MRNQTRALRALSIGLALAFAGTLTAADAPAPLTAHERWDLYAHRAFWGPGPYLRAGIGGALAQWRDEPEPWEQGASGYGKRVADRLARYTLRESMEAGGAALLHHEVRYIPSQSTRTWTRVAHALKANFITWDQSGNRVPNVSRLGAVFGTEFLATRWMPDGYRDSGTALQGVGVQLGVSSGMNLLREFKPELKRLFRRK